MKKLKFQNNMLELKQGGSVMIDWNKPLEIKVWGCGRGDWDTNGWVECFLLKRLNDDKYWVTYLNPGYIEWIVPSNGRVEDELQIRNKKEDNMRAKFYFEKRGDQYTLTGWKNVMSAGDIEKKYGMQVFHNYLDGYYFYERLNYILISPGIVLYIGNKFSNIQYNKFIEDAKNAGKRLSQLIRNSSKPEKIEVVI